MNYLERIETRLIPHRDGLLNHRLYQEIDRLAAIQIFMEHHVFAVWDFMSLLKVLQSKICCVNVPWVPPIDLQGCRLINEIVLAEESDDDGRGGFGSHFDLYYRSMRQCGANTAPIDSFLASLRQGASIHEALRSPTVPVAARPFVQQTFQIIESGNICAIASAFTYGREDLLPDVFQKIVDELNVQAGGQLEEFKYYLERHIGLDGDEHGPMATRLLHSLCGTDDSQWEQAEAAAVNSLIARRTLWDGISAAIRERSAR